MAVSNRSVNVPGVQKASTMARVVAGLKDAGSKNVAPINKPSAPAKHSTSPIAGIQKSEKLLKSALASGKVKDLNATRQAIAKKTGNWPNGNTN